MFAIYWLQRQSAKLDASDTPGENERLLNGNVPPGREAGYGSTQDETKGVSEAKLGDAQTTTWLDYVVGFRKLFPFLW